MTTKPENTPDEICQLRMEVFEGPTGIAEIANAWRLLSKEVAGPLTFFQSASWCINWLKAHDDVRPVIVAVWHGDQLSMLMPLAEKRTLGGMALETLTGADAEYSLPLVRNGTSITQAFSALLDGLHTAGKWDLLQMNSVPENHPLITLADDANSMPAELEYSSVIELEGLSSLDDYLATRSKSTRRSLRRKMQAFEKIGQVTCSVSAVTEETMKSVFATICEWKREWFVENGVLGGNFNGREMERHLLAFCQTDGVGEPTLASELQLDGELVACDLMLQGDGVLYSYVTARDLAFHTYGVGTVMDMYTIRHAIENGYKAFDLLSAPNPSKDSLSNRQIPLQDVRFPLTGKGRMMAGFDRLRLRNTLKNTFYSLPLGIRQRIVRLRKT